MIIPEGINTKEFYMILSSVTDKPYLGDDMSVFCFEKKADGMKFIEEHKSTKMGFKPMVITRPYLRDLFLSAVANVNIKTEDGRQISIPLSQKDFRDHLGNEKAVKNLMLLKQTGIKKYLRNLKECDFYMPVHIDIRKPGSTQKVHGCRSQRKGKASRLIFVTVWDFNEWNKHNKQGWNAVKIPFKEAVDMADGEDINIYKHLIIDKRLLKAIREEKEHGK